MVGMPDVVAAIIMLSLNAYVLLGGADFGGGVWDLLASGQRKDAQRALIADAIQPIWEANHVWLILVIVLLFSCFPPAFAALAVTLHVPLALLLVGIVLRGSAFTFRAYSDAGHAMERRWGRMFAIASLVTPLLLGVCVGAVASARVGVRTGGGFVPRFVDPWLTPFALGVGVLALALFAFLAAVYLTVEAGDDALREDFRRRALGAAAAVFVAAGCVLLLSHAAAPRVRAGLTASSWALPLHLATGVSAITAIAALWTRSFRVARLAAAAQVSLILWGWAFAQYPYLIPPQYSIAAAAAPPRTLALVIGGLAAGTVVLAPSLAYLFRVFKAPATAAPPAGGGA